jgi:hypothetical protein
VQTCDSERVEYQQKKKTKKKKDEEEEEEEEEEEAERGRCTYGASSKAWGISSIWFAPKTAKSTTCTRQPLGCNQTGPSFAFSHVSPQARGRRRGRRGRFTKEEEKKKERKKIKLMRRT